ncbi:IS1182 family transposase [bacterium]|nr:IS1182 family transposase [bacterium]TLN00077.1 MAG: IS1182 family transposase [bacterium]
MRRKPAAPVFKPYVMHQQYLLPPSYDELIETTHLVRVVSTTIDKLDLRPLLAQYKGGGTSSYHPQMLLKVLVYAYSQKIYSSRKIAKALRENIHFMWISGEQRPDFRTINDFRGSRMRGVIDEVFAEVLEYLIEAGKVKMEHYYVDGTKIEADANKHKVVWAKRKESYQKRLREQIGELLKEIEAENEAEQEEYGEKDLEERGGSGGEIDSEKLRERIERLNQRLRERQQPKKETRATRKALKKLAGDCLQRLEKYEQQTETLAGRSSYAKTDPDASCMRMKEDRGAEKPWPKPAYNVQIGTEGQFILGFSVHNRAGDTPCLIPHLEQLRKNTGGRLPRKIVADAAYGSEENYAYLEQHKAENFLKYNTFYQDTHHYRQGDVLRAHQFRAEHFAYDPETDTFICPADKRLHFQYTARYTTDNAYQSERRNYECFDCAECPLRSQCTKAKGNRKVRISFRLLEYRKQARQNLTSVEGQRLRAARSTEVETVFGHVKHNMGLRRFHLRGLEKVKTEWGLVSIAHNLRKMAA